MTNTELTKIREEKKLSKSDFAKLLGISPMLLGKYEKGSCAIPESITEKLSSAGDAVTATEIEVIKNVRKAARDTKGAVETVQQNDTVVATEIEVKKNVRKAAKNAKEAVETVLQSDEAVATEIEVKKNVRKAARNAKEAVETVMQSDEAVATEIEVKKNTRKAARKVKEAAEKTAAKVKKAAKRVAGLPNIVIQSPMGGYISAEDIAKKVPKNTSDVYVKVEENMLYYVLENGETGSVEIWE